jgi:hypothetical protein
MRFNINLTDGRSFIVEATSKTNASEEALRRNILTRDDFFDILSIEESLIQNERQDNL